MYDLVDPYFFYQTQSEILLDGELSFENGILTVDEKSYQFELIKENRSHIEFIHKLHQQNLN